MELFPFLLKFEPESGFEPLTYSLPWSCSTTELLGHIVVQNLIKERNPSLGRTLPPPAGGELRWRYAPPHRSFAVEEGLWCWGRDSNPRRRKAMWFTATPVCPLRYPSPEPAVPPSVNLSYEGGTTSCLPIRCLLSRPRDLNPEPTVYKTVALPLS